MEQQQEILVPLQQTTQDVLSKRILEGDSIFLIDPDNKKNIDYYIQPLRQLLARSSQNLTIILVGSRKRLLELQQQFNSQEEEQEEVLARGSGLLIVTTRQLNALLCEKRCQKLQLNCLVLDELEKLEAYGGSCFQALKTQLVKDLPQLLVTTRIWKDEQINNLLHQAKQPLLLIKDSLEAAIYGGVAIEVTLSDSLTEQLQQLRNYLLRNKPESQRTLIYCSGEANLRAVQQVLPKDVCLLHRGRRDKASIELWQRQDTRKILLLRSYAPELHIEAIETLIHFNMPHTWSQFRKSFGVYKSNTKSQLKSLILLDKQKEAQMMPHLIEFMQQHSQPIDEQLTAAHARLQAEREASLVARQCVLCPVLLLYGSCSKPTCLYRHILAETDRNCGTVPDTGYIRFELLKICTPAHFAARLVAHRATVQSPWQTLDMQQRYTELQQKLRSYYASPEHRVAATEAKLKEIYVRQLDTNYYERVCITSVPAASTSNNLTVRVKNLDLDTVIYHVKLSELIACPQQFKQFEALALDVRLPGTLPYNGEEIWQGNENAAIAELLHPTVIYEGKLHYSLSHTNFVSDLKIDSVDYLEELEKRSLGKFDDNIKDRLEQLVKAVAV